MANRALLDRGLHDGPADEVREADLARRDLRVQLAPSGLERGDVDLAEARRRRDGQRGGHVLRQPRGGALDRRGSVGDGRRRPIQPSL